MQMKGKLARIAAAQLNVAADQIEFVGGKIGAKGNPDNAVPFARLAATSHWSPGVVPDGCDAEGGGPLNMTVTGNGGGIDSGEGPIRVLRSSVTDNGFTAVQASYRSIHVATCSAEPCRWIGWAQCICVM